MCAKVTTLGARAFPAVPLTRQLQPGKVVAMRSAKWPHVLAASTAAVALLFGSACQGLRPLAEVEREGAQDKWLCERSPNGGWDCADRESARRLEGVAPPAGVVAQADAPTANVDAPAAPSAGRQAIREAPAAPPRQKTPAAGVEPLRQAPPPPAIEPPESVRPPRTPPAATRPPPVSVPSPAQSPLDRQLAHPGETPLDLLALPAGYYALQLLAMSSQETLDAFAVEHGLRDTIRVRVVRGGEVFYVLLAGVYADQDAAEQALESMPVAVRALRPWIRPLGLLQRAMREAEAGHPSR